MKIAVLGSNGFVGSSLVKHLSKEFEVTPVNRQVLNLLDPIEVRDFLRNNYFDVIVNAAASMTASESYSDARNNLGLFMNFYNNSGYFAKFINLASGAEFDRQKNIEYAREELLHHYLPADSYGFSQNIKSRLCADKKDFYNLRIFNCFGKGEPSTRIFPRFISKQSEDRFEITDDRYFDYFCIQDLCTVVENFVVKDQLFPDVNCVYNEKYKISDVVKMFANIHNLKDNIAVVSTSNKNYTGNGKKLESFNFNLIGLEEGLRLYHNGI